MKGTLIRTAVITSVITALAVLALAHFAMPHMGPVQANSDQSSTLIPAANQTSTIAPQRPLIGRPSPAHRLDPVAQNDSNSDESMGNARGTSGEPVVRRHRSTDRSVEIVAGSAGAGAAIGAIAGGGKGAAIGAISGGVAGLVFDRMTSNK